MSTEIIPVIIKRSEWGRGQGIDNSLSKLFNPSTSLKCCVGFMALATPGVDAKDIYDVCVLRKVEGYPWDRTRCREPEDGWLALYCVNDCESGKVLLDCIPEARRMWAVDPDVCGVPMTEEIREAFIKREALLRFGYDVTFED